MGYLSLGVSGGHMLLGIGILSFLIAEKSRQFWHVSGAALSSLNITTYWDISKDFLTYFEI